MAVHLKAGANANQIAAEHGFINLGPVGSLEGVYTFQRKAQLSRSILKRLDSHSDVLFQERQVLRKRYARAFETIHDPLWNRQWDLHGSDIALKPHNVWRDMNITGKGVTVSIVDDGLDHRHPDLSSNYYAAASKDINYNKADPTPFAYDSHGTAAGGCASAGANQYCGVGVAPQSKLSGIRLIAKATSDSIEASGLTYRSDLNDIYSSSWGPYDDGRRLEGPGYFLMKAFETGTSTGRGGRGSVYMWAAGNGRSAMDNCNYDGYANNRYTIPVGAIVNHGKYSSYSEPCSALYCVVPSSGGSNGGIPSTSTQNHCTQSFGGTSAASPLMSGVVAMMLEANPALTWRDVQHVIAASALKVDDSDAEWVENGGGYHHSHNYGFGRIDAKTTVNMSKYWVNVPPSAPAYTSAKIMVNKAIQNGDEIFGEVTVENSPITFVEHVDVIFQASHPTRGLLTVNLYSPHGTRSKLATEHHDTARNYPTNGWRFGSVRNWGENANGVWKVSCQDFKKRGGTFNWFKLVIYGH